MNAALALVSSDRLGWVLVHSLWQFLAIAAAVRLVELWFAGKNGAAARYVAGVCGLALMTAAPVITWAVLPAPAAHVPGSNTAIVAIDRPIENQSTSAQPATSVTNGAYHPAHSAASASSLIEQLSAYYTTLAQALEPLLPVLVACWFLGMSVCSLRPAVGWIMLRRLRTVGVAPLGPLVQETAREMSKRLRMSRTAAVLSSTLAGSPLVLGYLRPVLLMPVGLVSQLPPAELEAILAHELAHIRRHDFLVNLWQIALETVFFYHPAIWIVSQRLRAERENCCDDLALAAIGDPLCYGRALLHLEELRATEPVLALGASGGSLACRIRRLFAPPVPEASFGGFLIGVLLPSASLVLALATISWSAQIKPTDPTKPAPLAAESPRSLNIVIAEHSIIWDNRVRTWEQVAKELRDIRKAEGKPIHPNFYFTNEAHKAGHWETYKAKAYELYKDLFEPAGMSLGGISPRAGARYDVIRKTEDLIPDPKTLRSGVVVEKGQPKAGVVIVLVPEEGQMPVMLKPDLTLRDPLDEVWTVTDAEGRFTIPVQPAHATDKLTEPPVYSLAAISPSSYRLVGVPAVGEKITIELEPLMRLDLTPVEGMPQRIDLSFRGGLTEKSPGFSIYEIELKDKFVCVSLPPGKVTVMRSFKHDDGGSRSYPAEVIDAQSGERKPVKLPNISEAEAEKKWIEDSIRPKR